MGFLSNLFSGYSTTFTSSGTRDPYPNGIPLTSDKSEVAEMFLKYLDLAYQDDPNYSRFVPVMTSPRGIDMMKKWFEKFTYEELIGHNFADWLETSTKICFESSGSSRLTDKGITNLCKEVQKLIGKYSGTGRYGW